MLKRFALIVCVLVILVGCAAKKELPIAPVQETKYFEHKVSNQGETLALIAQWYTGNSRNWSEIAAHNQGLDVNRIKVGDRINIPEELVVQRKVLPKERVLISQVKQLDLASKIEKSRAQLKGFFAGLLRPISAQSTLE